MSTLSQAPPDFSNKYHPEHSTNVKLAPVELRAPTPPLMPQRPRRLPISTLLRLLIAVGIGVGGGLAWHTYSDMARQMAATAYPDQLSWLMPPPSSSAPVGPVAAAPASAATVGAAAPATAFDQQQLNAVSLGVADVRRSVEELAAQVATVTTGQQQMAGDIARLQARLQASEQDIDTKITSAPPSRSAAAPVHRRARPHMTRAPTAVAPVTRAPTAPAPGGLSNNAGNLGGASAEAGHDVERNWLGGIFEGQAAARHGE
jgi:hypothetical protein